MILNRYKKNLKCIKEEKIVWLNCFCVFIENNRERVKWYLVVLERIVKKFFVLDRYRILIKYGRVYRFFVFYIIRDFWLNVNILYWCLIV